MTSFARIVAASAAVAATSARTEKTTLLAELIGELTPEEVEAAVGLLIGDPRQGRIGVGYAAIRDLEPAPADDPLLTLLDVDGLLAELAGISGAGSQGRRRAVLEDLFARAIRPEQEFLAQLLTGGIRQGAMEGVMIEAIARAASVKPAIVRRANMLRGDLRAVAATALGEGAGGLQAFSLELFRPLEPMLAKTAESVSDAFAALGGRAAVEWKLDGARVQVHRSGDEVRIYTRNLREVTGRLPEIVEVVRAFPSERLVLDGEVIALDNEKRPRPFQETMSRFGRDEAEDTETPLTPFFFDVLHVDGDDLIDTPAAARAEALVEAVDRAVVVPRLVTDDPDAAEEFARSTLAAGHEGVMVKDLTSVYQAGRRGAGWLKVKPAHTLDLVVLAVEWGHGRRTGKLSNLHLGARDPRSGEFVMLGKTFKGLTDEMLEWQTRRFLELETGRKGHVVYVRPEQVVEIAFDGVQASSRYPGGMALRFARVKGYRDDKPAGQADTIDTVRGIFSGDRAPR